MARSTRKSLATKDTPAKVAATRAADEAATEAAGSTGSKAAQGTTPRIATKTASATEKVTEPVPAAENPPVAEKPAPAKKAASTTKRAAAPAAASGTTNATAAVKAPATRKAAPSRGSAAAKKSATRKSPARKAPVSSLVVQEGEDAWTKAELSEVLGELNEQREHSHAVLRSQESELTGLMRDSGDGAGQDQADLGATSFERDHELTVVNSERDKLAQIERALGRIDDGSYGVCESCGAPIGKMRLMAFPRATLCMRCKQREERR